jgi:hypothetical protein
MYCFSDLPLVLNLRRFRLATGPVPVFEDKFSSAILFSVSPDFSCPLVCVLGLALSPTLPCPFRISTVKAECWLRESRVKRALCFLSSQ